MSLDDLEIKELIRVALKPGDTLVLMVEKVLTPGQRDALRDALDTLFPNNKCLCLDGGMKLAVIEGHINVERRT